jgi:hypothetical protein
MNIIASPSFNKICYIDKKNNMIDITNKCPIDLCIKVKKIIKDLTLDKNSIKPVEDIYHYIIEKLYLTPEFNEEVNFDGVSKEKLSIAFNKFFFDKLNENI